MKIMEKILWKVIKGIRNLVYRIFEEMIFLSFCGFRFFR